MSPLPPSHSSHNLINYPSDVRETAGNNPVSHATLGRFRFNSCSPSASETRRAFPSSPRESKSTDANRDTGKFLS